MFVTPFEIQGMGLSSDDLEQDKSLPIKKYYYWSACLILYKCDLILTNMNYRIWNNLSLKSNATFWSPVQQVRSMKMNFSAFLSN